MLPEKLLELRSYVEKDNPCGILAMPRCRDMHLDEKRVALDILSEWEDVRDLIWKVISRLWLLEESWNNATLREHLEKIQYDLSLMQAEAQKRGSTKVALRFYNLDTLQHTNPNQRVYLRGLRPSEDKYKRKKREYQKVKTRSIARR